MKSKKFNFILVFTSMVVLGAFTSGLADDKVEWDVYKTLKMEATPIDMAITPDGRRIFVLTETGEVLIYSSAAKVEAKIDVGKHVDQIKAGPRGDTLIIRSSKNKTVEVVTFDIIQNINTTGAPFKGFEDAAVVIAVFDDFE